MELLIKSVGKGLTSHSHRNAVYISQTCCRTEFELILGRDLSVGQASNKTLVDL